MATHAEGEDGASNLEDKPLAGSAGTPSQRTSRQEPTYRRNYAQELAAAVTSGREPGSSSASTIVSGIRHRAELLEKALVQAKQAAIDTVADSAVLAERAARQQEALRSTGIEVLSQESMRKLAALDADHYRELHDPRHKAQAALIMADTTYLSAGYHKTLLERAPDVAGAVQTALALAERSGEVKETKEAKETKDFPTQDLPTQESKIRRDLNIRGQAVAHRSVDVTPVTEQSSLNGIEQDLDATRARTSAQTAYKGTSHKERHQELAKTLPLTSTDNQLTSNDVFTPSPSEVKAIVPADVEDRYLRVGSKYYHPKNTHVVAFEDKGNKLETRSNSEQIVETLVAIARARGWDDIKVTGSERFRRQVWLEAAASGMQVQGYTPSEVDKAELLKRSRESGIVPSSNTGARALDKTSKSEIGESPTKVEVRKNQNAKDIKITNEPQAMTKEQERAHAFVSKSAAEAIVDHPGLAGAYAAIALMKKKTAADGLNPQQQAIVMAHIEANVANSIVRGELPQVRLREHIAQPNERSESRELQR